MRKVIEYTKGQKVGELIFVSRVEKNNQKGIFLCPHCMKEMECFFSNAKSLQVKGCRKCFENRITKKLNGLKVGELEVICRVENAEHGRKQWLVRCSCGTEKVLRQHHILSGRIKSCGCILSNRLKNKGVIAFMRCHNINKSIYHIWGNMIKRCTNPSQKSYPRYGGRGISVCREWMNSFENFYFDIGQFWQAGLQLDRIDNDGNYEIGNVRWATPTQNIRNSTATKLNPEQVTEIRKSQTSIRELAEKYNVTKSCIKGIKQNRVWKDLI